MGIGEWITLIQLVLQFPDKILAVAKLFQDTPEEKHNKLLVDIQAQAKTLADTGRPG